MPIEQEVRLAAPHAELPQPGKTKASGYVSLGTLSLGYRRDSVVEFATCS
jgi:hypothetical protein